MGMGLKNNLLNKGSTHNQDKQHMDIYLEWLYCFQALDFALNSPQAIAVPDDVHNTLDIAKHKLENLMAHYEQDYIEEIETRA